MHIFIDHSTRTYKQIQEIKQHLGTRNGIDVIRKAVESYHDWLVQYCGLGRASQNTAAEPENPPNLNSTGGFL
jgi:hypothetical protein